MTKLFLSIILLFFINTANSQYKWESVSYTHSKGSNSDNTKMYYIIKIENNGEGNFEYFDNGKLKTFDFNLSRANINFLNSRLNKSRIYEVNPKELRDENIFDNENIFTMTISLSRDFGNKYEYKFDKSKILTGKELEEYKEEKEREKKEGKVSKKLQIIPIPNNLKEEYKKNIYDLYYDIELLVPSRIWNEAGAN